AAPRRPKTQRRCSPLEMAPPRRARNGAKPWQFAARNLHFRRPTPPSATPSNSELLQLANPVNLSCEIPVTSPR
ncbi:hypothetical protein PanWU01x14_119650, partial [Parasponia andersonii]